MVFLLLATGLAGWVNGEALAPKGYLVSAAGRELMIPYQSSHELAGRQESVRRVVIAVHSSSYRPQEAYNAVLIAMGSHAGEADAVCIVAPQFLESAALPAVVPDNLLYWSSFPFRGTSSARWGPAAQRVTISVLDVLDRMLGTVTDPELFPNLETVVIVGHSAGGQLVNRYAIAGRFEESLLPERGIHLRYLVLAPSSFLYFTPERDVDGDGIFELPGAAVCPGYDDWGYGMQELFNYPAGTGFQAMLAQYPRRFVFYLVGSQDNDPADPTLGTGCESTLQGAHRVARATTYFNHLLDVFGPTLLQRQAFAIVPGVGHSYSGQLNSPAGRRYLLDRDSADTDGDGQTDWAEWIGGTDPADRADRFRTHWQATSGQPGWELAWPVLPGRRYRMLEAASPAGPFAQGDLIRPAEGADWARRAVDPGPQTRYYRVQAELD